MLRSASFVLDDWSGAFQQGTSLPWSAPAREEVDHATATAHKIGGRTGLSENTFETSVAVAAFELKSAISAFSMHLGQIRDGLIKQVEVITNVDDMLEDDPLPTRASMQTLLRALVHLEAKRRPGLGVSEIGNILAFWANDNHRLALEFIPGDLVRWTAKIFQNGALHEVASGRSPLIRLPVVLAPYGVQELVLAE